MSYAASVVTAAVAAFVFSSVWYMALAPVEMRVLGPAAPDRGGRPAPAKALLELVRTAVVAAVVAGLARALDLDGVGSTLLLGLVLWVGFPLMLLTGSIMWESVPAVTAALHAGDWLIKLLVIALVVGLWL
jgi:hypothetical protein